ncbi:hypothetical protein KDD93_00025 [Campylobacter sp. faydin G-24]|uniref:DUF2846 domain-containing protein n=1 Tax=Campylobacter anatolicus TaxID=2829105 RepID=A0ABS5HFU7_9BACT|nr:hypothetical protein [Campylobacter anatolicus]MBR8462962.1 hypothetical protein [Campylobacter anatolicus]
MKKVLLLAFMAFLFIGCSAKGPSFEKFEEPETDKALLYVYRDGFMGAGVYYDIHVKDGDKDVTIGTLRNKGYLKTTLESNREVEIWAKTEARNSIILNTKPNELYCIKSYVGMGFLVGHPHFEKVSIDTCKKEIIKTNLSIDTNTTK